MFQFLRCVLFCWAAFLSISLLASVFPVSLPLFFLFLRPCLIHARQPEGGRAFVHGHTFLHSWSGPMTLVAGLLHGATFLSNLPLVLFVSFIGPWQLERTPIKPHLKLQFFFYYFFIIIFFSLLSPCCFQLVVVPYQSVLQPATREACGIRLAGSALIVDEAHNLLGTLAASQEVTLSYSSVRGEGDHYEKCLFSNTQEFLHSIFITSFK